MNNLIIKTHQTQGMERPKKSYGWHPDEETLNDFFSHLEITKSLILFIWTLFPDKQNELSGIFLPELLILDRDLDSLGQELPKTGM